MQSDIGRWNLFGIDLLSSVRGWRLGFHELLWGRSSGIRSRLETPVALRQEAGQAPSLFVAESPLADPGRHPHETPYQALLLPDEYVLTRTMRLPGNLEADLDSTVALEVQANSPFPEDDTCWGWVITARDNNFIEAAIAIASKSSVFDFLRGNGVSSHEPEALPEIWCRFSSQAPYIVIKGFGEWRRARGYSKRLFQLAGYLAYIALIGVLILAVPGAVRGLQADKMERYYAEAEKEAKAAVSLRNQLAENNARAEYLQELVQQQVNYRRFLQHLTSITDDTVYLRRLDVDGDKVAMQGWAANAAAYMQNLSEDSNFQEVKAPSPIRRDARSGLEQFSLTLRIADGVQSR